MYGNKLQDSLTAIRRDITPFLLPYVGKGMLCSDDYRRWGHYDRLMLRQTNAQESAASLEPSRTRVLHSSWTRVRIHEVKSSVENTYRVQPIKLRSENTAYLRFIVWATHGGHTSLEASGFFLMVLWQSRLECSVQYTRSNVLLTRLITVFSLLAIS
jgi:hypothetical protein